VEDNSGDHEEVESKNNDSDDEEVESSNNDLSNFSYDYELDDDYESGDEKVESKEEKTDLIEIFNKMSLENIEHAWDMGETQRGKMFYYNILLNNKNLI
jgi:hypothetical protein